MSRGEAQPAPGQHAERGTFEEWSSREHRMDGLPARSSGGEPRQRVEESAADRGYGLAPLGGRLITQLPGSVEAHSAFGLVLRKSGPEFDAWFAQAAKNNLIAKGMPESLAAKYPRELSA
jgi:hypothetical protein